MKRIVLIWMAAFLMGGMAMAQHARHSDKMPEPKVRAERMTERMVKEYSLNDTQKQQKSCSNRGHACRCRTDRFSDRFFYPRQAPRHQYAPR